MDSIIAKVFDSINIEGTKIKDHMLAEHTTYKVGGSADVFLQPRSVIDLVKILKITHRYALEPFILGGGANILVADRGIRGIVIDMTKLSTISIVGAEVVCGAGALIHNVAQRCGERGLSGIHHFYGMPGTVGGAVWMNARCFDQSIAELLVSIDVVDSAGRQSCYLPQKTDFAYKVTPFQSNKKIMLNINLKCAYNKKRYLMKEMRAHYRERKKKGHYDGPSAGSVFKNNRAFGKPSGVIIDSLGLRGYQIGGAKVSDRHANIMINSGTAQAADFCALFEYVKRRVFDAYHITLEQEVLYVGDWE